MFILCSCFILIISLLLLFSVSIYLGSGFGFLLGPCFCSMMFYQIKILSFYFCPVVEETFSPCWCLDCFCCFLSKCLLFVKLSDSTCVVHRMCYVHKFTRQIELHRERMEVLSISPQNNVVKAGFHRRL